MTIKDDNRFYLDKEVFKKFQQQNPTGYFHLLYLVSDANNIILNKSIRDLQSKITDQEEKHQVDIDDLKIKQRESMKNWKKRFEELHEENSTGDTDVKNQD